MLVCTEAKALQSLDSKISQTMARVMAKCPHYTEMVLFCDRAKSLYIRILKNF